MNFLQARPRISFHYVEIYTGMQQVHNWNHQSWFKLKVKTKTEQYLLLLTMSSGIPLSATLFNTHVPDLVLR